MLTARQRQKRSDILVAASDIFLANGYERTNLDLVIKKVGGSKQTLYRYFGNKRGLLLALVEQLSAKASDELRTGLQANLNYKQILKQFLKSYLREIMSPQATGLFRVVMEQSYHDPELAELFIQQGPKYAARTLAEYITILINAKELKPKDSLELAEALLGMGRSEIHMHALFNKEFSLSPAQLEQHCAKVVELFSAGAANKD